eukprot:5029510-Amphidinium_carterae.1
MTEGVVLKVLTDLVSSWVLLPTCDAESVGCTVLTGPLDTVCAPELDSVSPDSVLCLRAEGSRSS